MIVRLEFRRQLAVATAVVALTCATANSCETPQCPAGERTARTSFVYAGSVHIPGQPPPDPKFTVAGSNFTRNTNVTFTFFSYPAGSGDPFERYANSDGNGAVSWSAPLPPDGTTLPKKRPNDENSHVDVFIMLRDSAGCVGSTTVDSFKFRWVTP
ncbi:hypothetical protein [Rhodococcus opacus]|uniref:Secreted protein n=1 Tax=Rhodococcus opacus TaxID=37919 RepID=A0A076EYM2_RHOOP|nr:hypothetical protein [Rhodococcus opacus]AII10342.1 hypothetical protein EP51_39115 [Rhodococcus opacus]